MTEAGRLLRHVRRRAGLSQRALADLAGVPQSTVGRVEAGLVDPAVGTLSRLVRACGATLEALPGSGAGVDRSVFLLDVPVADRLTTAAEAEWLAAVEAAARRPTTRP